MKSKTFWALCLSLIVVSQFGHATNVNPVNTKNIEPVAKTSLLEKAVNDKKIKGNMLYDQNSKVFKAFNSAPTQNFLAYQNQQFSKFIQSIFSQTGS